MYKNSNHLTVAARVMLSAMAGNLSRSLSPVLELNPSMGEGERCNGSAASGKIHSTLDARKTCG